MLEYSEGCLIPYSIKRSMSPQTAQARATSYPCITFAIPPDSIRHNRFQASTPCIHEFFSSFIFSLSCASQTSRSPLHPACHQAIHTFVLAVDFRNYALLSKVFSIQFSICKAHYRTLAICFLINAAQISYLINQICTSTRSSHPMLSLTSAQLYRQSHRSSGH